MEGFSNLWIYHLFKSWLNFLKIPLTWHGITMITALYLGIIIPFFFGIGIDNAEI